MSGDHKVEIVAFIDGGSTVTVECCYGSICWG